MVLVRSCLPDMSRLTPILNSFRVGSIRMASTSACSPRMRMVSSSPSLELGGTARVNHRLKLWLRL
ncbi:hypothetical protein D3C87_2060000 [compost metagenome]